jgi:hypothetical protein
MPKAIQVTKTNIDFIIKYADNLGFNLDYLHDSVQDLVLYRDVAGLAEVLYVITDGSSENQNVTFMTITGTGLGEYWTFAKPESPTKFVEIKRIK